MSAPITRRAVVHGAAWSVPVILAAVAVPLAAASTVPNPSGDPFPVSCGEPNRTGQPFYPITMSDGTVKMVHRSDVVADPELKAKCDTPDNGNEGL